MLHVVERYNKAMQKLHSEKLTRKQVMDLQAFINQLLQEATCLTPVENTDMQIRCRKKVEQVLLGMDN